MNIQEKIKFYIPKGSRLILALSGGPDSVFLFYQIIEIMEEWDLDFLCAHLHHGIRKEADGDLAFVKDLCQRHSVELVQEKWDVPAYAKERSMSVEEAGRLLRYDLFYRLAGDKGYIALAHHLQDQAETLLMRMIRGTGIHGLGAMRVLEGKLFRPMLDLYKKEILDHLDSRNYNYCLDHTNDQAIYLRNKIRLELVPYLKTFNPNVEEALGYLALQCQEAEDYLVSQAHDFIQYNATKSHNTFRLDLQKVRSLDRAISSRVFRLILEELRGTQANFSRQNVEDILVLCQENVRGAEISLPDGYIVRRSYEEILVEKKQEGLINLKESYLRLGENIFGQWILSLESYHGHELPREGKDYIFLSDIDSLSIRTRRPGDRISLGSYGSKKIKDLFIDEKVDRRKRDTWPLVFQDGQIIWVPGLYRNRLAQEKGNKYILKIKEKV